MNRYMCKVRTSQHWVEIDAPSHNAAASEFAKRQDHQSNHGCIDVICIGSCDSPPTTYTFKISTEQVWHATPV